MDNQNICSKTKLWFDVTAYNATLMQADSLNDLFRYETTTGIWTKLTGTIQSAVPPPTTFLGMTALDNKIYLFGGDQFNWGQNMHDVRASCIPKIGCLVCAVVLCNASRNSIFK